jgi:hypothetical protein
MKANLDGYRQSLAKLAGWLSGLQFDYETEAHTAARG